MAILWHLLIAYPFVALAGVPYVLVRLLHRVRIPGGDIHRKATQWYARAYLKICRIRFEVGGQNNLRPGTPYIFCANHASFLDPIAIIAGLSVRYGFLAQRGPYGFPFLFTRVMSGDSIAIPGRGRFTEFHAFSRATKQAVSLVVFPEGGMSADGSLGVLKEGAAQIAIHTQAPLVPVAIVGTARLCPAGSVFPRAGTLRVLVGNPIPTAGLEVRDRTRLTAQVRAELAAMLGEGSSAAESDVRCVTHESRDHKPALSH